MSDDGHLESCNLDEFNRHTSTRVTGINSLELLALHSTQLRLLNLDHFTDTDYETQYML